MSTVFYQSPCYLEAFKQNGSLTSDEEVCSQVQQELKFHYGSVTQEQFSDVHKKEGWQKRKVKAIFAVAWSGILKVIFHLAQAIIGGVVHAAMKDRGLYFRAKIFSIGRDFQEAFGWMATLFKDCYGQRHVQEALFHKECYMTSVMPQHKVELSSKGVVSPSSDQVVQVQAGKVVCVSLEEALKGKSPQEKDSYLVEAATQMIGERQYSKALTLVKHIENAEAAKERLLSQIVKGLNRREDRLKALSYMALGAQESNAQWLLGQGKIQTVALWYSKVQQQVGTERDFPSQLLQKAVADADDATFAFVVEKIPSKDLATEKAMACVQQRKNLEESTTGCVAFIQKIAQEWEVTLSDPSSLWASLKRNFAQRTPTELLDRIRGAS